MKITEEMRRAVFQETGREGGKIGGPARAAKLSPARRAQIASDAAKARWGKRRTKVLDGTETRAE